MHNAAHAASLKNEIKICLAALVMLWFLGACTGKKPVAQSAADGPDTVLQSFKPRVNKLLSDNQAELALQLLDSLEPVVKAAASTSVTTDFYCMRAAYHIDVKNYDSAKQYYDRVLSQDTTSGTQKRIGLLLGNYYRTIKKPDSALFYVRDVYNSTLKGDSARHQLACCRMVEIYEALGDQDMIHKYAVEGFYIAPGSLVGKSIAVNLGTYYADAHQMDSALYFYGKYILPDSLTEGESGYINRMNAYANLFRKNGQPDSALKYFFRAAEHAQQSDLIDATLFNNIAVSYADEKKYDLANRYLDSAIKYINTDRTNPLQKFEVLFTKGRNLYYQGNAKEGFVVLDSALAYYVHMTDSSYRNKARELETQYAVKTKDEKIKLLGLANTAAKKDALQKRFIIIILGVVLLLLVIVGIAIFRRRQLAAQLKQAELEQRLLRTQMEPHFIFNSLAVLQSQIRAGEQEKAGRYLNQFARLLRSSLENSREAFVPLNEEVEALQNYMSLQSMRFEEVFDFHIDVYNGYEDDDVAIPPMLLQPFVENAIHHGMQAIGRKGNIDVSIQKQEDTLLCTIKDNGRGYKNTASQSNKKSLSSVITKERLAILSRQTGKNASLLISSVTQQQGTVVEMIVPYKRIG